MPYNNLPADPAMELMLNEQLECVHNAYSKIMHKQELQHRIELQRLIGTLDQVTHLLKGMKNNGTQIPTIQGLDAIELIESNADIHRAKSKRVPYESI